METEYRLEWEQCPCSGGDEYDAEFPWPGRTVISDNVDTIRGWLETFAQCSDHIRNVRFWTRPVGDWKEIEYEHVN